MRPFDWVVAMIMVTTKRSSKALVVMLLVLPVSLLLGSLRFRAAVAVTSSFLGFRGARFFVLPCFLQNFTLPYVGLPPSHPSFLPSGVQ